MSLVEGMRVKTRDNKEGILHNFADQLVGSLHSEIKVNIRHRRAKPDGKTKVEIGQYFE